MTNISTTHSSSIAICMITQYPIWYPGEARSSRNIDKVRGDLALESVQRSVKKGFQTIVGYSTNSTDFNRELKKIKGPILVKRETTKSSPAKLQLIQQAVLIPDIKVIVLTEPEKVSFIKGCVEQTVKPIFDKSADIVVPKRDPELFRQTYPNYMYESEQEGIKLYNEELRSHGLIDTDTPDFDMFFGPRSFANKKRIVELFLKEYTLEIKNISFEGLRFDPDALSNTQFFPVVSALQNGIKVQSVIVPFRYPASQKENEEIHAKDIFLEKRKSQRLGLIIELLHFVSFLEKNKSSRIYEE